MARRGVRGGLAERADPNLIPLLDVVLQLITFFMMLIHVGTRLEGATEAVRLAEAPAALPSTDLGLDRLAVGIDAEGRLLVDGEVRESSAAQAWWREQAARRREGLSLIDQADDGGDGLSTLVVVRADRAAPYGRVRATIETARQAGFTRFTLVVLREEP